MGLFRGKARAAREVVVDLDNVKLPNIEEIHAIADRYDIPARASLAIHEYPGQVRLTFKWTDVIDDAEGS